MAMRELIATIMQIMAHTSKISLYVNTICGECNRSFIASHTARNWARMCLAILQSRQMPLGMVAEARGSDTVIDVSGEMRINYAIGI